MQKTRKIGKEKKRKKNRKKRNKKGTKCPKAKCSSKKSMHKCCEVKRKCMSM
ncbi:uncharacterized protein DS421_5g141910 [Arachis hypogaea]|nr:uncharacterized protein DS421_5g141910 [Arachis hypogaea]